MKKRKISIIVIILIVVVSLFLLYKNSYTEFKPLSFDGNSYVSKKISNQELIVNYTKKALDKDWHKEQ